MEQLLLLLILLACPLAMFFMMRGGHGHQASHDPENSPETDARITELEREIARLRAEAGSTPQEAKPQPSSVADRAGAGRPGAEAGTASVGVRHG